MSGALTSLIGVKANPRRGKQVDSPTARRRKPTTTAGRLRVAIATTPSQHEQGSFSLLHELRMVRSADLYADEVELVSPGTE